MVLKKVYYALSHLEDERDFPLSDSKQIKRDLGHKLKIPKIPFGN